MAETINVGSEYSLKYWGEFGDYFKKTIRVEFYTKNFIGEAREIETFPANPVSIITTKKKIYEPVLSTGAKIKVLVENEGDYRDLFTTPRKENRVLIKRDGKVIYNGFVEPDLYEEDLRAVPYPITIPCIDGLKILEDVSPDIVNETGLVSKMEVIKSCLREINIDLPLLVNCSLFASTRTSVKPTYDINPVTDSDYYKHTNTIFTNVFVESQIFEEFKGGKVVYQNAFELLEDVLKTFTCKIYQDGCNYRIERIQNKSNEYDTRWIKYNLYDDVVTYEDQNNLVEVGSKDSFVWCGSKQKLSIESPCSEQVLKVGLKEHPTVIFNNYDDGILNKGWSKNLLSDHTRRWSRLETEDNKYTSFTDKFGINKGMEKAFNNIMGLQTPIFQHSYISAPNRSREKKEVDKFSFSFKIHLELADPVNYGLEDDTEVTLRFSISFWMNSWFLKYNMDSKKWEMVRKDINTDYEPEIIKQKVKWGEFDRNGTYEYSMSIDFKELDESSVGTRNGEVQILIYPHNHYIAFGESVFKHEAFGDVSFKVDEVNKYDNEFTGYINDNYYKEAPKLETRFFNSKGEIDEDGVVNVNIMNNIFDVDYYDNLMTGGAVGWYSIDEYLLLGKKIPSSNRTIQTQLLKDGSDQYIESRNKIKGTVYDENLLELSHKIKVKGVDGMFMMLARTYEVQKCQTKIELEEVKKNSTHL